MRHSLTFAAGWILALVPLIAQAKTAITVSRFEDKTEKSRCPQSKIAKADLDRDLQNQLIAGLMELDRFKIQQREIRRLKPEHTIVGTVRTFEVCPLDGRGQEAQIAIEVQVLSAKSGLTHMFSSSAQASSTAANRAPEMAMSAAIAELIRRVDDALPRRATASLPGVKRRKAFGSDQMIVKLVKRERR